MNRNLFKITALALISLLTVAGCSQVKSPQDDGMYYHDEHTHWRECMVEDCDERHDEEAHVWSGWSTIKGATCSEYGIEERECITCDRKEKRNIAKKEHEGISSFQYNQDHHWKECTLCNVVIAGSKADHNFETWTTIKEATVAEDGLEKGTCKCGYEIERLIPKIVIPTQSIEINLPDCVTNNAVLLSQGSFDVSYNVIPNDATDYSSVEVTSTNNEVATINEGKVQLLKEGFTEIIVSNGVKEIKQPLFVTNLSIDGKLDDEAYSLYTPDVSITTGAGYSTTNTTYVMLNDGGLYISHYVTDKFISSLSHIEAAICFGNECNVDNTLFMNMYPVTSVYEQVRFFNNVTSFDNATEITNEEEKIHYASASNIVKENENIVGYEIEVFIPYGELEDYGCSGEISSVKYIPLTYQYMSQADADRATLNKIDNNLTKNIAYGEIDTLRAKYLSYLMPSFNKDKSFTTPNRRPIAEYTFDNGVIANTGTNTAINGRITTIKDGAIEDVDNPTSTFDTDANGNENGALLLTNNLEGEHFTISGVDLGTNDFTISVKVNIKQLTTYTSSENFLFGIGSGKDVPEGFFGVNFKLNTNRELTQIRFRINGKGEMLSYVPIGEYCEFRVVRKGDTVYFSFDNNALHGELMIWEYQLNTTESVALNNYDIGFSSNIGCFDAGELPIAYDDIKIYDYAIPA